MNIKEEIEKKLKKTPSLPFLFIGSGISQRYIKSPTWIGLLKHFAAICNKNDLAYEMYLNTARTYELKNGVEPKIAELIQNDLIPIWFNSPQFEDSRKKYEDLIKNGGEPLKIEISEYFFNASKNQFSEEMIEEIKLLEKVGNRSIAGIITTNYDCVIEKILEKYKYNVFIGQEELLFAPITGISEIYKIHGCCTNPNSIVINDKDYNKFSEKNAYLAAKLMTIFLEHPIVFMGYNLGDANIKEILLSITKCLSKKNLEKLRDRFIFIEWNNKGLEDAIYTENYSIDKMDRSIVMTRVLVKDFSIVYEALLSNRVKYNPRVLRNLKDDIYKVVLESKPSKSINVLMDIDDDRLNEVEALIGVGIMDKLSETGYEGLNANEVYLDIVFDDRNFIIKNMVEKALPQIFRSNSKMPIYKYINQYDGVLSSKINDKKIKKYSDLLNYNIREKQKSGYLNERSISEIIKNNNTQMAILKISYLKEEEIDKEELHIFLKKVLNDIPDIFEEKKYLSTASAYRRLIRIYDYLEYGK
ncbi:SIR2 family protein [Clostridium beijerinckii]|uniref:SIR2-like domain-containing protein n=1 Tax=Clostridium beijerinckii TaxID=1520 RepID=A0AAX0B4M0_CLOBE|nr:SIR2 family protein [Clostridium beijerinckii]NRT90071.1 hypothetical protein [Clostridium beijerinckii]NYC69601.1 hypothetical protein [Clostridium beijerinckii]